MPASHPGFRIFVLGAGFSRPAGLPLASELFPIVSASIRNRYGKDTKFDRDLGEYLDYCKACAIEAQTEDSLDLELFMSYLDIEHHLALRGSDTWSPEGNESQLMIRKAIGDVIQKHTPAEGELPDAYYRFAESLSPHDVVLTFNYDLVLERALANVGRPFRRYPYRYESVSKCGGIVNSNTEEIVLLKMHGSVDWFDDRHFLEMKAVREDYGSNKLPLHGVFDNPALYGAKPLVEGLLPDDDLLRHLHTIERVEQYYAHDRGLNAPFILSPSHVKFVYAKPLLGFWNGIGRSGGYNLGISVIGFSLPEHDQYIRIGLYQMFSNYESWWDEPMIGVLKDYARFVDFKPTKTEADAYRRRYGFVRDDRSRFFFGGFCDEAIDFLFHQLRET